MKPNFLVILIDDLRYDEFGAGGHPYMQTPHIDRLAHEGAIFERAFHTTPICSPNRASIVSGQYASRHGIIDNVARDAMSHRLPNYHLELQRLGYDTAHIGKWHMGNDGMPRPGYDTWVSYDGHGKLNDPRLNHDGKYVQHSGYITDIMNGLAVDFLKRKRKKPFSLFLAHKAVHPDAEQAADGTLRISAQGGYVVADRHKDLYRDGVFPRTPNMLAPADVIKSKPAWADSFALKSGAASQAILAALQSGDQEEIRLRARMMASVDEGVGAIIELLEENGELDNTFIVFFSDNGFFFGEHALGPERRFAYEEGIRSPFVVRYPRKVKAGSRRHELVICQDLAPTLIELAGGKPGPQIQGRSLLPLFAARRAAWRKSILIEYWAEQAMPWLVGMTYKAVRTDRHKYIHWVNRGRAGELDELYDLELDPYELNNLNRTGASQVAARAATACFRSDWVVKGRSSSQQSRYCDRTHVLTILAFVMGTLAIVPTALSLSRSKVWWVRIWDFPRLQLCLIALGALVAWSLSGHPLAWPQNLFTLALVAVAVFQGALVWRYTPFAPREVQQSRSTDPSIQLSLVVANILQTNRQSDRVLAQIRQADPDVVLFCEVDEWWEARLDALATSHPYVVRHPLSNTYGLLLRSRLELSEATVDFLVKPDNPSIQAKIVLRNGTRVWLNCVHPPPPVPGESDESSERDSALLKVGRRVSEATGPVVVCGDLNDVAWSHSTRLFQKISGLLEPRKGRGFVSTFHARYPGFRVPIDHVFHSQHFRLVRMRRLKYVGSDHFPVHIVLSYEPEAVAEQEAPQASTSDHVEATETLAAAAPGKPQ